MEFKFDTYITVSYSIQELIKDYSIVEQLPTFFLFNYNNSI